MIRVYSFQPFHVVAVAQLAQFLQLAKRPLHSQRLWDLNASSGRGEMNNMNGENWEVVEYGYSIITYLIRYDQDWICLVAKLRAFIAALHGSRNRRAIIDVIGPVNLFPDENVYQVMGYLSEGDLRNVAVVNKTWNSLSCRDELWNNLLHDKFGVCPNAITIRQARMAHVPPSKLIYKEMLISFYKVLKRMEGEKFRRQPEIPAYMVQHAIAV